MKKHTSPIQLLIIDPYSTSNNVQLKLSRIERFTYSSDFLQGSKLYGSSRYTAAIYLVDQTQPVRDVMHQISKLAHINTETKLMLTSGWKSMSFIITCLKLDIFGFYNYRIPLENAIHYLIEYDHYFGPDYQPDILKIYKQQLHQKDDIAINHKTAKEYLTKREIEVLHDIVHFGGDLEDIATRLFISPLTLKNHINSIRTKLGANNRTHAVTIALKKGIIYTLKVSV